MSAAWMSAFVALWVLALILAVAFMGTLRRIGAVLEAAEQALQAPGVSKHGLPVGARVPWFEGVCPDGTIISTANFGESPATLLFLSGVCLPCHQLASELATLEREKARDLGLWVVVREQKDLDELALAAVNVILQPDGSIQQAFQTTATPHAFAIKNGLVAASGHPNTAEALLELAYEGQKGGGTLLQPAMAHQPQ
jgi:hypothetical protein